MSCLLAKNIWSSISTALYFYMNEFYIMAVCLNLGLHESETLQYFEEESEWYWDSTTSSTWSQNAGCFR